MDMSLDDMIKQNQRNQTSRGTRGRGGRGGTKRTRGTGTIGVFRNSRSTVARRSSGAPYQRRPKPTSNFNDDTVWEHDLYEEEEEEEEEFLESPQPRVNRDSTQGSRVGTRLHISNLEYSVDEQRLQALFGKVGTISKVIIHYDKSGRSEGTGEIIFRFNAEARSALSQLNGAVIDGKAIQLKMTNAPHRLQSRVGNRFNTRTRNSDSFLASEPVERRSFKRGRGGAFRTRASRFISKSQSRGFARRLDQELDDYRMDT